jgi:hypothetical protein
LYLFCHNDIRLILNDYHKHDAVQEPAHLTGILFGALTPMAPEPEQIKFSEQDYATARVVWSIIATDASDWKDAAIVLIENPPESHICCVSSNGSGIDPRLVDSKIQKALLAPLEEDMVAYFALSLWKRFIWRPTCFLHLYNRLRHLIYN